MVSKPEKDIKFLLLSAGALLALVWIAIGTLILPRVVHDAYYGHGIEVLNRAFQTKQHVPLASFLNKLRLLVLGGALGLGAAPWCLYLLASDVKLGGPLARKLVPPATAVSLAGIRICVLSVAFLSLSIEDVASTALLPPWKEVVGGLQGFALVTRLPGGAALLASHAALTGLKYLTLAAIACGLVGYRTRLALPVAFVGYWLAGGALRLHTHFFHTGLLSLYLMGVLCLSPCGDAWSLDVLLARRAGRPLPSSEPNISYGWARFCCWCVVALTYFAAGTSKLLNGGVGWWNGVNLKHKVLEDALNVSSFELPFEDLVARLPIGLYSLLGLVTLAVETGFIVVPFSKLARRVFPLTAVGMHLGIFFMQEILFLDLLLIHALFYDHTRWVSALARWARVTLPAAPSGATLARVTPLAAVLLALIPLAYLLCIGLRVELFPLTKWAMYSDRAWSTRVQYFRYQAFDASGRATPLRLEDDLGVFRFNRAYDVIPFAFEAEKRTRLRELLDRVAELDNEDRAASERVVRFELTRVAWDFAQNPDDPQRGRPDARFVHEVGARPE